MKLKKLTLLELIIAILVLGLLTALAMPQFIGVKANADVAAFKNDIDVLHKAVDEMYVREDSLPLGSQVNTAENPLDAKLLDVVYASGDSGNHLYKIDLDQSKKYHNKLKTPVDSENYFMYSKETGKIFYTKGMIDGDNKTLYTMEYIGLSNLKMGANPLVNNMSVPVDEAVQIVEGSVPVDSDISVSINGTNVPVTYEDIAFEGVNNILAASKTKKFTSEVLLTQNKNVLTIKTGSTVTNFNVYLGESGEEIISPVIKPVAVISMSPEPLITTETNVIWGYENSTASEGNTIVGTEWEGKQDVYPTEGSYTIRLRVQDSSGIWSDWVEKSFIVIVADGIKEVSSGGYQTFILKKDDTLWGTGRNISGELGLGNNVSINNFIQIASDVKSINAGLYSSFYIKNDGTLWATGLNNHGQLGTGDTVDRNIFTQVEENVSKVKSNQFHTLIIKTDNSLWGVGRNDTGALGLNDLINRENFTQITTDVKDIALGGLHSLVLKNDNSLWTTGYSNYGQLGDNTTGKRMYLKQVLTDVEKIDANSNYSLAVKSDGTLWVAGYEPMVSLGSTSAYLKFTKIKNNIKTISAGLSHILLLTNEDVVLSSGAGAYGQLGTGKATNVTFVEVQSDVKEIHTGAYSSFIIKHDDTLWGTGANGNGTLGTQDNANKLSFTFIQ